MRPLKAFKFKKLVPSEHSVAKPFVFEPVEGYAKSLEKSISRSLDRKQDFGLLFYLN
jgi:hypothetical protein